MVRAIQTKENLATKRLVERYQGRRAGRGRDRNRAQNPGRALKRLLRFRVRVMLPTNQDPIVCFAVAFEDPVAARRLALRVFPIPARLQIPFNKFHQRRLPESKVRRKLERQRERADRKQLKTVRKYAKISERRIQNVLARRRQAEIFRESGRKVVSVVKFDYCLIPKDGSGMLFHIDGSRNPHGVLMENILSPEVARDLSRDLGRTVTAIDTVERCGAFFVVNLGEGVRRLPTTYYWHKKGRLDNVMDLLPSTRPSEIAVGMGENRTLHKFDFRSVHMLVAGATGWGKTNWIRQALVTLVQRNPPDRLRLVLFDFKRGAGLRIFDGIPHMWDVEASNLSRAMKDEYRIADINMGFVGDKNMVFDVLTAISTEMDRRYDIFGAAGEEDIDSYNKYKHNKMPDLLIVMDELADLMLDPDQGSKFRKEIEALILRVAQQGRGAGVFLWAATQTPKREVITTLIKYNLVIKIAFNCTHRSASVIVLDHGGAAGLETRGRLIYQRPGDPGTELQGPLLEHADAKDILVAMKDGKPQEEPFPEEEIFRWVIENNKGALSQMRLREQFGERVVIEKLTDWLASLDYSPEDQGPLYVVGGQGFIVISGRGNKPRRMWPIDDETRLPTRDEYERILRLPARSQEANFVSSISDVAKEA